MLKIKPNAPNVLQKKSRKHSLLLAVPQEQAVRHQRLRQLSAEEAVAEVSPAADRSVRLFSFSQANSSLSQ